MMIEWLHIDGKWECWFLGIHPFDSFPLPWEI